MAEKVEVKSFDEGGASEEKEQDCRDRSVSRRMSNDR